MPEYKELQYKDFSESRKEALKEIKSGKDFMDFVWYNVTHGIRKADIMRMFNLNDGEYQLILRQMRKKYVSK